MALTRAHLRAQNNQQPTHNGQIQLTPPISLRLTSRNQKSNGLAVAAATNNFQQLFSPDDNVTNNNNNNLHMNNNNSNNNKSQLTNGIARNGLSSTATNTKNRLNGATSSALDKNKFTPDTEFVADFGAAHIFNGGGTTSSPANHVNGNHKFMNGNSEAHNAGSDNANADFADFDHNPIYNAAGNFFVNVFIF